MKDLKQPVKLNAALKAPLPLVKLLRRMVNLSDRDHGTKGGTRQWREVSSPDGWPFVYVKVTNEKSATVNTLFKIKNRLQISSVRTSNIGDFGGLCTTDLLLFIPLP